MASTVENPLVEGQRFRAGKGQVEKLERPAEEERRLLIFQLSSIFGDITDNGKSTAGRLCHSIQRLHHLPGTLSVLAVAGQSPEDKVRFRQFRPVKISAKKEKKEKIAND